MPKYIQGDDGKFAGSIGDGKHKVPNEAVDIPNFDTPPSLTAEEQHILDGMRHNLWGEDAPGHVELVGPAGRSKLTQAPGLFITEIRVAPVQIDETMHDLTVGAAGTWNLHPFEIAPDRNGYSSVLAIYPQQSNPKDGNVKPLAVTNVGWGAGIAEVAEVLNEPLLDSMFGLTAQRLWYTHPQVAEKFPFPGVERPQPQSKKSLLARLLGR